MTSSMNLSRVAALLLAGMLLLCAAGPAGARGRDDDDRGPVTDQPLDDYDYDLELNQSALNTLLERFTHAESQRRTGPSDERLKELTVRVNDGGYVVLDGRADLPVMGGTVFHFSGKFKLKKKNQFRYQFKSFSLSKEIGGIRIPLSLLKSTLLSLFGLLTQSRMLTDYLEISASWTTTIPLFPTSWKWVDFTLKPKAMPLLNAFDAVYLGWRGNTIILQGKLREGQAIPPSFTAGPSPR